MELQNKNQLRNLSKFTSTLISFLLNEFSLVVALIYLRFDFVPQRNDFLNKSLCHVEHQRNKKCEIKGISKEMKNK
jgi:hypothetical protein